MNPQMLSMLVFFCTTMFVLGTFLALTWIFSSEEKDIKNRCSLFSWSDEENNATNITLRESENERNAKMEKVFSGFPRCLNLPVLFEQAGVQKDVALWLISTLSLGAAGGLTFYMVTRSPSWTIFGFGIAVFLPYFSILRKRKKRISQFETYLPQSLEIVSRSLRSGHPLSVGLQMVSTEIPDPVGSEFGRVSREHQLGLPLEEALRGLTRRVDLLDLRFLVLSILIHRQTGGDLAEVLDNLSTVIRDRLTVLGQVRALTAEGRLSGWVLSLLPVLVFLLIWFINPGYMNILLEDPVGNKMLYSAVFSQFLGILMIRKIVKIKV